MQNTKTVEFFYFFLNLFEYFCIYQLSIVIIRIIIILTLFARHFFPPFNINFFCFTHFFSLLYRFHKLHVVYLFFFFMCVIYSSGLNSFPFRLVWLSIDSFCSFIVCFDVDLACSTFCFFFLLNPFNAPLCRASKSILIRFWN